MTKQNIFVFGSNLAGRHGKGSALEAVRNHGAILGIGYGLQGQSYGIPTKDAELKTMPLSEIRLYVNQFIWFAINHSHLQFNVVDVGCGLAGYAVQEMAPLFGNAKWLNQIQFLGQIGKLVRS